MTLPGHVRAEIKMGLRELEIDTGSKTMTGESVQLTENGIW
jgi:hypothetical protein